MATINSIPLEVNQIIFGYLPFKECMINTSLVCKQFQAIAASIMPSPEEIQAMKLMIPKLDAKVVQSNALTLWDYKEGTLDVDETGRIYIVAFYHLTTKLALWNNPAEKMKKLTEAIVVTFQEIYRLNRQGSIEKPEGIVGHQRLYVWNRNWFYSHYHPADYLAKKILTSDQFANPEIQEAAKLVVDQSDLYEKNCTQYGLSPNDVLGRDERILWNDCKPSECFFGYYDNP